MKDLEELKRSLSTVSAQPFGFDGREAALQGIYAELRKLEMAVAQNPDFMGFYEVGEMRKFIGELHKALGV